MKKGSKIIIGVIIAIVVIIVVAFAVYYISFRPKMKTTSTSTVNVQSVDGSLNKLTPEYINTKAKTLVSGNKEVSLSQNELTNMVAYGVANSPSVSKYVTGVKVEPKGNDEMDVYVTGNLHGVSSQAKLEFEVHNVGGHVVLEYEDGKVGFVEIPEKELFNRLHDNNYITVNRIDDSISINPNIINGQTLVGMNVDKSNLNLVFKA